LLELCAVYNLQFVVEAGFAEWMVIPVISHELCVVYFVKY